MLLSLSLSLPSPPPLSPSLSPLLFYNENQGQEFELSETLSNWNK